MRKVDRDSAVSLVVQRSIGVRIVCHAKTACQKHNPARSKFCRIGLYRLDNVCLICKVV